MRSRPGRLACPTALLLSSMLAGAAVHAASAQWGGIAYLPDNGSSSILRYRLPSGPWLEPLPGHGFVLDIAVDESGIYTLSYGGGVFRSDFDGVPTTTRHTGGGRAFAIQGPWLFVADDGELKLKRKADGSLVASTSIPPLARKLAVAPAVGSVVVAAESFGSVPYTEAGTLGDFAEQDDRGLAFWPIDLWTFPDGARVLDDGGHVLAADDLRYLGNVPLEIEDAVFAGDVLIAAGDSEIGPAVSAFATDDLAELGVDTGPRSILQIDRSDLFFDDGRWTLVDRGYDRTTNGPLEGLGPLTFAEPGDPDELSFFNGPVVVTREGVVCLAGRDDASAYIARFDLRSRRFLESLPLRDWAHDLLYDAAADAVYVAYRSRRVGRIAEASGAHPTEELFAATPEPSESAALAGRRFVFSGDGWSVQVLDAATGELESAFRAPFTVNSVAGAPDGSRLYFRNYGDFAAVDLDSEGRPGEITESDEPADAYSPIWSSPDGSFLFEGKAVRDAETLRVVRGLGPAEIAAASWLGEDLAVAARTWDDKTALSVWRSPFGAAWFTLQLPYEPIAILPYEGRFLVVVREPFRGPHHFLHLYPGNDYDGDGISNDADLYPFDPSDSADRDGDGVGDNADAFPDDPAQHADRDGDRIADPLDAFPDDPERAFSIEPLKVRLSVESLGALRGALPATVHLLDDGGFLLCTGEQECIPGSWRVGRKRRIEIEILPEALGALEAGLERDLEAALSRRHPVDLQLELQLRRAKATATVDASGREVRLELRLPYVARTRDLRTKVLRGAFTMRGRGLTLAQ